MPRIVFTATPKLPRDMVHLGYQAGHVVEVSEIEAQRWFNRDVAKLAPAEDEPEAQEETEEKGEDGEQPSEPFVPTVPTQHSEASEPSQPSVASGVSMPSVADLSTSTRRRK